MTSSFKDCASTYHPDEHREYSESAYFSHRLPPDPDRQRLWSVLCEFLTRYVRTDDAVLELGGGYCDFINHIRACEKHVVDVFDGILKYAGQDVKAHVGSCVDLSEFRDESFHVIFASNLFEHLTWPELERTTEEIYRVLRPKGKLILIQPNFKYSYKEYFDDYTHRLIFTDRSLRDYLGARGFRVCEVVPRFLPYSMKSRYPKPSWLLRLYLASPIRPLAAQMLVVAERPTAEGKED
jgi:ubiquinone/menaquinone biosynthesis C-methylase UbiE